MASSRDDPLRSASHPDVWEAFAGALATERRARGESSQVAALSRLSFREWADGVPEPGPKPLDFEAFPFQVELYSEDVAHADEVVVMKATQLGISTWALRWVLFHADVQQRTALYTFPTSVELNDFSRQRIGPTIRASSHLRRRIPADAIATVAQKQVGTSGWVYFRGVQRPIDSIAADVAVFDEYDSSDQENLEASERRLSSPTSTGLLRRIGVPSVPGFGISVAFEESDQRGWTVKCAGCGEQNRLVGSAGFARNVDQDTMTVVCAKCRRTLDMRAGEWVALYPDRSTRGYAIPQYIARDARIDRIVARSKRTRPDQVEAFYQRDLGEPYAPAEGRLSLEQVQACVRDDLRLLPSLYSDRLVTMGVDMASSRALNVVIEESVDGNGHDEVGRRVFVGEVEDIPGGDTAFEQLCALMDRFGVNMAGIDNSPDGRFSQAFAARFPGRVYRCSFFTPAPGARRDAAEWHVDDAAQFVSLWRTKVYDSVLERFRTGCVQLPPLDALPPDYPSHLGAVVRRSVEVAGGNQRVEYVKTGPEDYAQAEAYNLVAIELWWRNRGRAAALEPTTEALPSGITPTDLSSFAPNDYLPGFS